MSRKKIQAKKGEADIASNWLAQHAFSLYGHERQENIFLSLSKQKQIPHAWIFSGLKGIGKSNFAFRLARWLSGAEPDPDYGIMGTKKDDPISQRLMSGAHDNFIYISRIKDEKTKKIKDEIPVSEVRKLTHFFQTKTADKDWKIAVIDAVDELNLNASNALLKLLEEPPHKGLILLVSHQYESLLDTLKSRCIKLEFNPLGNQDLTKTCHVQLDSHGLNEQDRDLILSLSKGSPGRLNFLLNEKGTELYRNLYRFFQMLPHSDFNSVQNLIHHAVASTQNWVFFQEIFLDLIRNILACQSFPSDQNNIKPEDLEKIMLKKNREEWIALWYKANQIFYESSHLKLNTQYALETVLSLCHNQSLNLESLS